MLNWLELASTALKACMLSFSFFHAHLHFDSKADCHTDASLLLNVARFVLFFLSIHMYSETLILKTKTFFFLTE